MYKYIRLYSLYSALIILVSITEISCMNSSPRPKDPINDIFYKTTNEPTQTLPTLLNRPEKCQKPDSNYNSAKKQTSQAFATDLKKSKNPAMMIIDQSLGYVYLVLMVTSGVLIVKEPLKIKSSSGLSKDYLLIGFTTWFLMMFNDIYGFFGNSLYKKEEHISDITLSFTYTMLLASGLMQVHVIPGDPINKFSYTVMFVCTVALQTSAIVGLATNLDTLIFTNGIIKSGFALIECIPQYILIYRLKTTRGFSIPAIMIEIIAYSCAILQILFDYYGSGNGTGFWHELNLAKFFDSVVGISMDFLFIFQDCYYKYFYKSQDSVVPDIDEIPNNAEAVHSPNDLAMKAESKDNVEVIRSKRNSQSVKNRLDQDIFSEGKSCSEEQSPGCLRCHRFAGKKSLLARVNRWKSEILTEKGILDLYVL